jgi:hypothetical protein
MMDLFATALKITNTAPPAGRTIDGRDILPLFTSTAASPHPFVCGQAGPRLATVRDARWKLHVLPPSRGLATNRPPGFVDPWAPDGVTILAPYEQAKTEELPGVDSGDAPKAMQLFDLQSDPSEQRDVAAQFPSEVTRLKALYDSLDREVPPPPPPAPGKRK